MNSSCRFAGRIGSLVTIGALTILLSLNVGSAGARETAQQKSQARTAAAGSAKNADPWSVGARTTRRGAARYFIEFRARSAASYGHMYLLYGKVNARQEIVESRIAGLHPAGDAANCFNCSLLNWTIGHLIPVPAETGASDGDLEAQYVTARYRVWLDAAQYRDIDAYIRKLQADNPMWNALWNNCVGFGRATASHMRLELPSFIWLEPKDFVEELRKLNGVTKEQLPLKDAANSLRGAPVGTGAPNPADKPSGRAAEAPRQKTAATGATR